MARKPYTTVSLDPELFEFLESKVKDRTFASISHGVNFCVAKYMEYLESERPRERQ